MPSPELPVLDRLEVLKDRRRAFTLDEIDELVAFHLDQLGNAIHEANFDPAAVTQGEVVPNEEVFNWRGLLYDLSWRADFGARQRDIPALMNWLAPQLGEVGFDVNAGEGMMTLPLAGRTEATVFSIDSSDVQINTLRRKAAGEFILPHLVQPIVGSLADADVRRQMGEVDYGVSFAGAHHYVKEGQQEELLNNVANVLRPGGRFIVVDVDGGKKGEGTPLSRHFETTVKRDSLTGHREKWLTEERIRDELAPASGLEVVRVKSLARHAMIFKDTHHMVTWARAIHALPQEPDIVLKGLQHDFNRGRSFRPNERDGRIHLPWQLLIAEFRKPK